MIDSQGEQLGILTKAEALTKARENKLDIIEIAPNADPPVARIVDFKKFRYEESKKERAARKGSEGGLKELWLSPRIAEHDLEVRLKRTREFLDSGHKVKLTVKFKGREMAHQELGYRVLKEVVEKLGDGAAVERDPKMEGRKLSMIVTKVKGGKNAKTEDKQISAKESQNNIPG